MEVCDGDSVSFTQRRFLMVKALILCLLLVLVPVQAGVHEGTGPRTDAGGNINNLSGIVYAPEHGKFLGIRQNNTLYVYDPETMANGHESTSTLTGCPGGDKESITMVDPWGLRGYGDVFFIMDEDEHTLCAYSVAASLSSSTQSAVGVWDLDTILTIAYNASEGLLFIPNDPACSGSMFGGCFVVNLNQHARTLHKVNLRANGSILAVGESFTVDAPCGWTGGTLQDLNYDWRNQTVYVLNPSNAYSHSCVLDKTMTQYVGVSPFPIQWKFEGFAWGAGYCVWANDNDSLTGQMISFQLDAYTANNPLCFSTTSCPDPADCTANYCVIEECVEVPTCNGGVIIPDKQNLNGGYKTIGAN
jgi:hypothetical protein